MSKEREIKAGSLSEALRFGLGRLEAEFDVLLEKLGLGGSSGSDLFTLIQGDGGLCVELVVDRDRSVDGDGLRGPLL